MKTILLAVLLGLTSVVANAQQRPHYTQYVLNQYVINPAITGIENYGDLKISVRDQWVGLNGAPRTAYLTVHAPVGKEDYRTSATSYSIPGQNPRGQYYWENYTAAEPHHGIGLSLINDKTGNFNRFTANVSYAYHLGLNATTNLSGGFATGVTVVSLDRSKLDFGNGVQDDPALGGNTNSELRRVRPDLSAGLYLYSRDYFVGISGQQIIPQKLSFVDDAVVQQQGRLVPHLFLTAGYRFLVNEDVNAIPSVMFKYINASSRNNFQVEGNVKLQYRDLFWVGGSYRHEDGFAAMGGLNVLNLFNVGYAYDFTQTKLNTVSRGTHELMLGFLLGNKYSQACPRCW